MIGGSGGLVEGEDGEDGNLICGEGIHLGKTVSHMFRGRGMLEGSMPTRVPNTNLEVEL